MPGQHKESTIAFRPNAWQKAIIEERAKESGLLKKDFITRSCIYANITVVGKKENVQRIVDEVKELQITLREVARQLQSGNFALSEAGYKQMKEDFLATAITLVDILDGAAYLFGKEKDDVSRLERKEKMLEDCRKALLGSETQDKIIREKTEND